MEMKRAKRFFDGGFFSEFERMQEMLEEMMSESIQDFNSSESAVRAHGPLVYGFSFKMGSQGRPVVNEFGNIPKKKSDLGEREPLVDVIDGKLDVRVIAELPGVDEKEISLVLKGKVLGIKVMNKERRYAKKVKLPAVPVSKKYSTSFKNGILEVVLRKV